jgi:hypothetical protein
MHKPNKIPGMKVKGIDRKRDRSGLYNKRDRSFKVEQAKNAKSDREEIQKNRVLNGTNKRSSRDVSEYSA